jgi:hypothetical protein
MTTEVEKYFKKYILSPSGFIYNDINREIDLARTGKTGAELMTALGLLTYTEFMGKILLKNNGSYTKQFSAFFRLMDENYTTLIDSREIDVYTFFRSGMVQSFFMKDCEIKMLDDNYPCGIIVKPDGRYLFIIEKYFTDFTAACRKLYDDMLNDPDIYLPTI